MRLIDADKLLNKRFLNGMIDGNELLVSYTDVVNAIRQAPTVDAVEVKRGEWHDDNRLTKSSKFRCSVCDGLAYFPQPTRDKAWKRCCPYKYCPNCGAKNGRRKERK